MAKDKLISLGLEGCKPEELRKMAEKYLGLPPWQVAKLSRAELVARLSQEVRTKPNLRKELKHRQITFKPSFYLLSVSRQETHKIAEHLAQRQGAAAIGEINSKTLQETKDKGQASPHGRGFQLERVSVNGDVVEGVITWQVPLRYWQPADVPELRTVAALEIGFFIVDLSRKYAVIACHSLAERERIGKVVEKIINGTLTPLRLTKPLLERIGDFTKATRAAYALLRQPKEGQKRPSKHSVISNCRYAGPGIWWGLMKPLTISDKENMILVSCERN